MATAKKTSTAMEWRSLVVDTLPANHKAAYEAYRLAFSKASALRKTFEDMVNKDAAPTLKPKGKQFVFSYRYGLGVAIADIDGAKTTNSKAVSLSDYLNFAKTA